MSTSLQLYNTLTRRKDTFAPIDPKNVRMYVCGPTVYDFAHLGNARPVVVFDTLYRLLKRHYPRVTYVRNITDIDDKIITKSENSGEPIATITARTLEAYHNDMAALNALPPDKEPRCTENIPSMLEMIQSLIDKGHAYIAEGHVLFHVPSMPEYGELSHRSRDEQVAGARVEVAPYKKDPADFVLWKPSTPKQPGWDSPWGRGRPGWHIECSAMAKTNLGVTFDIHGGGLDLIFPHHENEIAQSRCAHDGAKLANIWMHNGFLTITGDKMSKSAGNFFTVRDLLDKAPGEALRFALLSAHYRQPIDFSEESLKKAKTILDRWYNALRPHTKIKPREVALPPMVEEALCDDLNTPLAIAKIHDLAAALNATKDPAERASLKSWMLAAGDALGLLQQNPEIWFKKASKKGGLSDEDIDAHIDARLKARASKDYAESDRIRDLLADAGIILEDGPKGTTWRRG